MYPILIHFENQSRVTRSREYCSSGETCTIENCNITNCKCNQQQKQVKSPKCCNAKRIIIRSAVNKCQNTLKRKSFNCILDGKEHHPSKIASSSQMWRKDNHSILSQHDNTLTNLYLWNWKVKSEKLKLWNWEVKLTCLFERNKNSRIEMVEAILKSKTII